MPGVDTDRAKRLDRQFDALLCGWELEEGESDSSAAAALRHLHILASRPVPDSAFVDRLRGELTNSETAHRAVRWRSAEIGSPPCPVLPGRGRSLHWRGDARSSRGMTQFPGQRAQNDTVLVDGFLSPASANGHTRQAGMPREDAQGLSSRLWWQRWEIAAALLVIVIFGGYLAVANLARPVSPLARLSAITAQSEGTVGTAPARLRIGALGIDAAIERVQPYPDDLVTPWAGNLWATGWQDGGPVLIPEPSEPWSVAWLAGSAAPDTGGNVVLYGHLDSFDPGHAVFWNLNNLTEGDQIDVIGEDHEVFTYAVEWSRRYPTDVEAEQQRAILGPTDRQSLTLITNAGAYDQKIGTYPEILVVRATLVTNSHEFMEGQPWRLRSESIHLDTLIAPRQPPDRSALIPVGSALVSEEMLDKEWILIQPGGDSPSVVSWREDTAAIGEGSNVVLEGHRYVSGTEPAVFRSLNALRPGSQVELYGSSRLVGTYEVEWIRQYPVAVDPRQRQEILGPTETESLTLISDAGAFDRETDTYSEILVVRARFLGSAPLLVLTTPGSGECTVEPRTVEEISAVAAMVLREPRHRPDPTPLEGEPADAATKAAVIAAERKLVACLNANDPLRAYALYTDEGLERLLDYTFPASEPSDPFLERDWDPDFSTLSVPATPLPEVEQIALVSVDSVRVLPDGRIAATATIESGGPGILGIPTGIPVVHIFEPGDRYLIDEFIVPE